MAKKEADKGVKPDELIYELKEKKPLPQQKQIILICGEEDYYRNQIMQYIPDYFLGGLPESDRQINVFEKNTDMAALNMAINTYPFFGGISLVILNDNKLWATRKPKKDSNEDDAQDEESSQNDTSEKEQEFTSQKLEQLTELISDVPEYCILIINAQKIDKRTKFYKQLKEKALICVCDKIKDYNLPGWLQGQAARYGARFTNDAEGTVMEYIEPVKDDIPLGVLEQEISKLAIYAGGRKQWTREDVLDIFASLPNASTFAIINSVSEHKLKETLEILAIERKRGTNILPISAMIAFKIRQILRYLELKRDGYDQKEAMDEMNIKNFYAMKFLVQYSKNFDEKRLREALLEIADLNAELRRGGRNYGRLEEILVCLLS